MIVIKINVIADSFQQKESGEFRVENLTKVDYPTIENSL